MKSLTAQVLEVNKSSIIDSQEQFPDHISDDILLAPRQFDQGFDNSSSILTHKWWLSKSFPIKLLMIFFLHRSSSKVNNLRITVTFMVDLNQHCLSEVDKMKLFVRLVVFSLFLASSTSLDVFGDPYDELPLLDQNKWVGNIWCKVNIICSVQV